MLSSEYFKTFKSHFFTGLFVTFPLVLTILAIKWMFELFDSILGGVLEYVLGRHIWGLGFVLSVIGVFAVGIFATTVLGRKFLDWNEKLVLRLPVIKSFYSTFKQLGAAFSPDNRAAFKEFVVVEYPSPGLHSFGFMTKECVIKNHGGKEESYTAVYIPTNHIYLGDVVLFKKEEVTHTELSIEEGIKIMLSAGIGTPSVIDKGKNYARMAEKAATLKAGIPPATGYEEGTI